MAVLTDEVLEQLPVGRVRAAVQPAVLMSSMNMHGFSVTLLPADDIVHAALDSPVDAIAWPGLVDVGAPQRFEPQSGQDLVPGRGHRDPDRGRLLRKTAEALVAARSELDDLDASIGDGDTGTAFNRGASAIVAALDSDQLSTGDIELLADEIGELLAREMGGSSGVLLSILCTAMAVALRSDGSIGEALGAGVGRMQDYGGAEPGDRTMLDALLPAAEALVSAETLTEAARAARRGADATANMEHAGAGRAAYVPASALTGVVDPGAEAIARVFEALAANMG